jgi:REP element-mobilizing transposase RayT
MPGRNINKIYLEHAFYHVYSRGINKQAIFLDDDDYAVFLNLFKRYLSDKPVRDNKGREYPWLYNDIELLAFCLMPNHFHALVYQIDAEATTKLFRAVTTTYGMYFNKKYHRIGPMFQSRFRASMITNDAYLDHISRYIHLNPKTYKGWPFSSLPYYLGKKSATWVKPGKILALFDNDAKIYQDFVADYESHKAMLAEFKDELANQ